MPYSWDPTKRAANIAKHGVDFATVAAFEWETALIWQDTRKDYGEVRWSALGAIGGRLHHLTYTVRTTTRIISLRKASDKEIDRYESQN